MNRAYCQAIGDNSQPNWENAPDCQKASAMIGVELHLNNPQAGPEASHESWLSEKAATGWKFGPVKDPEKKEHPCMVPFTELPKEQQAKDFIFRAVVHALATTRKSEEIIYNSLMPFFNLLSISLKCEEPIMQQGDIVTMIPSKQKMCIDKSIEYSCVLHDIDATAQHIAAFMLSKIFEDIAKNYYKYRYSFACAFVECTYNKENDHLLVKFVYGIR